MSSLIAYLLARLKAGVTPGFTATFTTQRVKGAYKARGLTEISTPEEAAELFIEKVQTFSGGNKWNATQGEEKWKVFVNPSKSAKKGNNYQTLPGECCELIKSATGFGGETTLN